MILINLLPHREWARKQQRERFTLHLGLSVLAGLLCAAAVYTVYQGRVDVQLERNRFLQREVTRLDAEIKEVKGLQQEIEALKARQAAVESLQSDRNLSVHLFNELVQRLPDGVYLSSLKQDRQTVLLAGVAQSQQRVSNLLHDLGQDSPWLTAPELVEIVASTVGLPKAGQRRVFNFSIRVQLTPQGTAIAATPSSAAVR